MKVDRMKQPATKQIRVIFVTHYNGLKLPQNAKFICIAREPQATIDQLAKHNPQYLITGQLYFYEPRNPEEDIRVYWTDTPNEIF